MMMNSHRGSMSSIKSENSSCSDFKPPSPMESTTISEPPTKATSTTTTTTTTALSSSDMMEQSITNALTPPSLIFPAGLKFELDGDVEVESPDHSLWESLFSEHFDNDFMILSPMANTNNINVPNSPRNAFGGQSSVVDSAYSPPRFGSSPLGAFSRDNSKGKGLSPLRRVFNSPVNYIQQEPENLSSLPPASIEDFLDDYQRDSFVAACGNPNPNQTTATCTSNMSGVSGNSSSSSQSYQNPMVDCTMSNTMQSPSRFSRSVSERSLVTACNSQMSLESRGSASYHHQMVSNCGAPLSQQLMHERQQEKQQHMQILHPQNQHNHHNNNNLNYNNLVAPSLPPVAPEPEQDSGLQLVHLLLACAEAVAKEDYMLARRYLNYLNQVVSAFGDSMQRVAACFTEALNARLVTTLTTNPGGASAPKLPPFSPFPPNSLEILKIYQIVYQACPYIKFAHFTANQAIFEAFESEERVHVIDLDILQGYQWPAFMQALAARSGGAPFLRITGVGSCIEAVKETGRCLTELALSLHVPFEFHAVGEQLEDLKPHMFNRRIGEALAVNTVNRLHRVPGNSLGNLLAMIRDQAPNIVTLVEQEASHNGPYFLGRFLEALHYYSAIFDSLDATFPPDSPQRAKVEKFIFSPEIQNIVACEGAERTERHERLDKWRRVMEGKGFKSVPLSANAVTQSKILLGLYSCDGYRMTEDRGCLLLGWQDRSIMAASAWRI